MTPFAHRFRSRYKDRDAALNGLLVALEQEIEVNQRHYTKVRKVLSHLLSLVQIMSK